METKVESMRILLRIDEAAQALGLSRSTIHRLIAAQELKTVAIGRTCRITVESLHDLVRRKKNQTGP